MNFNLSQIPERTTQPRKHGLTMVMDKGLSYGEAENFLSVALPHTDIIKLGFGTSFVTPNLRKKIELYQSHGLPVYFGGTLFEAFVIRNQFDDYIAMCNDYKIDNFISLDIPSDHYNKNDHSEKKFRSFNIIKDTIPFKNNSVKKLYF